MLKSFLKGLTRNARIYIVGVLIASFLLLLPHPEIIDKLESLAKAIPLIIVVRVPAPLSKSDIACADEQICNAASTSSEEAPTQHNQT